MGPRARDVGTFPWIGLWIDVDGIMCVRDGGTWDLEGLLLCYNEI